MLLFQVCWGAAQLVLGMGAQSRLGVIGVLLLLVIGASIRARHTGLAVTTAVMFTLLMTHA